MKKASRRHLPRITHGIVPTAIASGLLSPVTMGAPGDLDPGFGDMGRVTSTLQFDGPAWSVQPLSGDESLFAGGQYCDYYCSYYQEFDDGFLGTLSGSGALESQASASALGSTEVRDVALQPDGKVIAVGRELVSGVNELTVLRLNADGTIDTSFANDGILHRAAAAVAQGVTLDPSGTIAVAGSEHGKLLVLHLLADGSLDSSFGNAGVYLGPPNDSVTTDILRTTGGAYRVSTSYFDTTGECRVIGITADGKIDNSFGTAGSAAPPAAVGASVTCASMRAQADGRLLLAGRQDGHGFAARLLASGAADASFVASQVALAMYSATALAVDPSGNVFVAGTPATGVPGALVVRLQANGALDPLYGNAGSAWIDLQSIPVPLVHDMAVLADGRVLAAGGSSSYYSTAVPFVVRLLGDSATPGAGVIGLAPSGVSVKEKEQTAMLTVRRTGGAVGAVTVAYHTVADSSTTATPGQDYTPVSGQLNWADGDRTDRHISVPIANDTGPVEMSEYFGVTLDSATGGAGLGTSNGVVEILGDGDPGGQFDFEVTNGEVLEGGNYTLYVDRNYYSSGATSVTLTPVAGSATSADFASTPVTLSWADGEMGPKLATFAITQDNVVESAESFTIQLSNPTNGAVIGPQSVQTVKIDDYTPPPLDTGGGSGGGGGGALDLLTLAGLGLVRWLRRCMG